MKLINPVDAARRARAAVAYSGMELGKVADLTGIKLGTLRNITSRTVPKGGHIERLWAIADACGVPRVFMEEGFTPLVEGETSLGRRFAELERTVGQISDGEKRLENVEKTLADLALRLAAQGIADLGQVGQRPPGERGRSDSDPHSEAPEG